MSKQQPKIHYKAPLPFVGQKRYFLKHLKAVLDQIPGDGTGYTFIDAFGGSGLLAHNIKRHKPQARVIYNDYDDYYAACQQIPELNALRQFFYNALASRGYKPKEKLRPDDQAWVRQYLAHLPESLPWHVISRWFAYSSAHYATKADVIKNANFFHIPATDAPEMGDYFDGLERVKMDFLPLLQEFHADPKAVFVLDPPYMLTEQRAYKNNFGLVRFLQLADALRPPYIFFSSVKSEAIDILKSGVQLGYFPRSQADKLQVKTLSTSICKGYQYTDQLFYVL